MKFTRRSDLDPQTRIHIVMLAWLHQGIYGKMTEIANTYLISRTFLYQLVLAANLQLEMLFSDEKLLLQKDHQHFEHLLLLLRLEGTLGRKLLASEYLFDFESPAIPPQFCRLSQSVFPKRGSDASIHPLDAVKEGRVLSQR